MLILTIVLFAVLQAPATPGALPATPQGKMVEGFIKALRTDEATFNMFVEKNVLAGRSPEQRKTMYGRLRKEFGDFKVLAVLSASAEQISMSIATTRDANATFTFKFEPKAPYRITEIAVEVD